MKVSQSCLPLRPHGFYSPSNSPGQNTGVDSFSLLQGIFPTLRLNPGLPHCGQILYRLSHKGSPGILDWVAYPFFSRSSQPRNWTRVSCLAGRFFTNWAIREAIMVAPRKRKSSKKYPRNIRMDIFLVRCNLQRYFPTHPLEPYKIKNKPITTKMGQTRLFVCLEEESNVKRNWKQGSERRWMIHQNCRGRARGKGSQIPTAIKIYFTDRTPHFVLISCHCKQCWVD